MTRQREVEEAVEVRVFFCDQCNNPHIALVDENEQMFATAVLSPEHVDAIIEARNMAHKH